MSSKLSDRAIERSLEPRPADDSPRTIRRPGLSNRQFGWVSLLLGATTGIVLGLWSFGGPAPVPEWLGEYGDVSRRLARLGHIAFFGLGILNILMARELPTLSLSPNLARLASLAMIVGNVLMPSVLFCAAAWHPCKYLLPIPALSVSVALGLVAYGLFGRCKEDGHGAS